MSRSGRGTRRASGLGAPAAAARVDPAGPSRLERAKRLAERLGKGPAERHHLADRLHLDAERRVGAGELLEREARDLDDDVIERRLERGRRLLRDVVRDLVELIADGEKRGDLRDREPGRLRGERRRARDAGIHLDDDPAPGPRVHGELDVRSARRDAHGADDLLRVVAHRLVLDVRERHLRRDRDRVARVDSHRVEILDRAHDDERVRRVAHDLELELLPPEHRLLDENLVHGGEREPALHDRVEVVVVEGDAASRAAERERGTDDDRVSERLRDGARLLEASGEARAQDVDADFLHRLLEEEAVLAELHRADRRPERLDSVSREDAGLVESHGEVERGLAADGRQQRVRPLPRDDRRDGVPVQRLDVRRVRELGVRHDRRRVRVHEDDAVALAPEHPARLRPRIVELAGLADHDRTRAEHENRLEVRPFRHRRGVYGKRSGGVWRERGSRDRVPAGILENERRKKRGSENEKSSLERPRRMCRDRGSRGVPGRPRREEEDADAGRGRVRQEGRQGRKDREGQPEHGRRKDHRRRQGRRGQTRERAREEPPVQDVGGGLERQGRRRRQEARRAEEGPQAQRRASRQGRAGRGEKETKGKKPKSSSKGEETTSAAAPARSRRGDRSGTGKASATSEAVFIF